MTQDTPSFFTLDRGTVSTTAALIAPVAGRYRMLASAAAPASVDPESVLEDLAWRVARTDASLAGPMDDWRGWSRLEVRTGRAPRACLVAPTERTVELLERAFLAAGWLVTARFFGAEPDLIGLGEACLDPRLDAVVVGSRDGVEEAELEHAELLWPRAASLARLRDDLAIIACGPFTHRPEGIPDDRLFALPGPEPVPLTSQSRLRGAAAQVGIHLAARGEPVVTDGRSALRASIASLAVLLDERVEGIEIGAAAGSRTLAHADGEIGHAVVGDAAQMPDAILEEDDAAEALLRWSTLGGDPAGRIDALRELALHPWTGTDREGVHLRLAATRAALERLARAWAGGTDRADPDAADVTVLAGGGFAGLPPAAAALALVDAIRRPGAAAVLHDHAGILAPLGALPVEGDRRRLLADLMDDCLLPVGSVLVTGPLGQRGKGRGVMGVSTILGEEQVRLEPGQLQLVDLPPGIVARLEIDPLEGRILGVEGRRLRLEVSGGLGGLLVDTRPIPLDLPAGGEQRRAALEAWEEAAWRGIDR